MPPMLLMALLFVAPAAAAEQRSKMEFEYIATHGTADLDPHLSLKDGQLLLIRRPSVAREGVTIGVFRAVASEAATQKLDQLTPSQVPTTPPMRPGMPLIEVRLKSGARDLRLSAPLPSAASQALAELTKEVQSLASNMAPVRAIRLECLGLSGPSKLRVRIFNPGSKAVHLDWASGSRIVTAAGLQTGGSLEQLTSGDVTGAPSTIAAGSHIDVEVPVRFPKAGPWQVRAIYQVRGVASAESERVAGATSSKLVPVHANE